MKKKIIIALSILIIPFIFVFIALRINANNNKDNKNNDDRYIIAEPTGTISKVPYIIHDNESIEYYYDNSSEIKYVENDPNNYHYYIYKINGEIQENRPVCLSLKNAKYYNNNFEEVSKEDLVLTDGCIFKIYFEVILESYPEQIPSLYVFI